MRRRGNIAWSGGAYRRWRCRAAVAASRIAWVAFVCCDTSWARPKLTLTDVGEAFDAKHVEFRGVGAGRFDPGLWEKGAPNLVADFRSPLIAPRDGKFRNIYAPSVVRHRDGWRIFYGGWDGSDTGNDRIYLADADDEFLAIANRRTVIEHGDFHHVCNVNVIPLPGDAGYAMACTAWPADDKLNKPVVFFSADGEKWNTSAARRRDLITMDGYEEFAAADINGMNVLLHEEGILRLYFNNFRDFGKTFRASASANANANVVGGDDARRRSFRFDGVALRQSAIVNDLKRFTAGGGGGGARGAGGDRRWYLMALHHNGPSLSYAIGRDGMNFGQMKTLAAHLGDADRHIVAVGWVVAGGQDDPDRRLLGFLYGAGEAATLDRNRIFARWLQKRVTVGDAPAEEARERALGPDRQLLPLPAVTTAAVTLRDEAGREIIAVSEPVELKPGRAYALEPQAAAAAAETPATPSAAGRGASGPR